MNLLQIRTKFRELSGRFDLVNEDFTDNGADFFINEGRKFLDRLDETSKSWGSAFKFIEVGFYSVQFSQCRAIKEVWAATAGADSARWQLEKKDLQELIYGYMTGLPSSLDTGNALYYSPAVTRYIPEDLPADEFEAFIGYVDIPAGNAHEYNAILVMPPTDARILIDVKGLFYSHELTAETDENSWSVNNPMLLHMSAMRQIEIINRNTQGVNDWTGAIAAEMKQLGMDLVEELIAEADQMEG